MKSLLRELRKAEKETSRLDALLESDMDNAELENQYDKAYEKEHELFEEAVKYIAKLANIDEPTTRTMLRTKREKVEKLFGRA